MSITAATTLDAIALIARLQSKAITLRIDGGVIRWRTTDQGIGVNEIRRIKRLDPEIRAVLLAEGRPA